MSKLLLGKKADISGRKMIFYIVVAILLSIAFLFIVIIVPSNNSQISEIPLGVENNILVERFLSSPYCFVFQDKDTKRYSPLLIDKQRFTQENLEKCYSADSTNMKGFRLTLTFENQKLTINTKNWQGFIKKAETKQVSIYDRGKIQTGELYIEIQDAK